MAAPARALDVGLLKEVSRSFYLTLRVLPGSVRTPIGLAYLLARTSDTIADTDVVEPGKRVEALRSFREAVTGQGPLVVNLKVFSEKQASPAERVLVERSDELVAAVGRLQTGDAAAVRDVLKIITSGQELDLVRFQGASADTVIALNTDDELDDYTYRVAGCVGEFWTKLCRQHVFPNAPLDMSWLFERAVRFGKGLQLVNILRDLPRDLKQGRCYLPLAALAASGLTPPQLKDTRNEATVRPVYNRWLDTAESNLRAGWQYTNALPARSARVRLACAWPILIGLQTIGLLRTGPVLDPEQKIKLTRAQVRSVLARSVMLYPWTKRWQRLGAP